MAPLVRPLVATDDLGAFGCIVVSSYRALAGHPPDTDYEAELADVAGRVEAAVVFGAFADGRALGCVTYVPDRANRLAEHLRPGEASFRMLAVAAEAQGRGVGEALVRRCVDDATAAGRDAVFVHSGAWMTAAHRLYGRLGFARVPDRDWHIEEAGGITLLGFRRPC